MRVYADSSFLLRLICGEADSPGIIARYRRLGTPTLFFLPIHGLEVRNAILQRSFHQRRTVPSNQRRTVARDRDAAFARLEHLLSRRAFIEVDADMDAVFARSAILSAAHTERLGARAIDILHVSCALVLESELFLTSDTRQAQLAKAARIKVA